MSKAQIAFLIVLSLVLAAIVATTVVITTRSESPNVFTPPAFDESAQSGTPLDLPKDRNFQQIKVSDGFLVGMCSKLVVSDDCAEIYLTASSQNTVWIRVVLLDENGKNIGSTGVLKPDQYVEKIRLNTVPAASTTVTVKIISYEPDTYYSRGTANAVVSLEISE